MLLNIFEMGSKQSITPTHTHITHTPHLHTHTHPCTSLPWAKGRTQNTSTLETFSVSHCQVFPALTPLLLWMGEGTHFQHQFQAVSSAHHISAVFLTLYCVGVNRISLRYLAKPETQGFYINISCSLQKEKKP